MRILWITGPPGVGKSTVAWRLYERRPGPVSHVDIDQLGMLAPAPADDPDRRGLKEAALLRLAAIHAEQGSRLLVVSGVSAPPELCATIVLRADEESIRTRLLGRGADPAYIRAAVEAHREATAAPQHAVVETEGRTIDDVVDEVERMLPGADSVLPVPDPRPALPPVVWVRSSRAVGASTVGFGLFAAHPSERSPAAFLDSRQLRLARGASVPRIPATIAVGSEFAARGARELVVVGRLTAEEAAELGGASPDVRVIRLIASPDTIAARVRSRAIGGPLHLAGDDLRGLRDRSLDEAVAAAVADAEATADIPGEVVVHTDGRDPSSTVAAVRTALGELAGKITER